MSTIPSDSDDEKRRASLIRGFNALEALAAGFTSRIVRGVLDGNVDGKGRVEAEGGKGSGKEAAKEG